MLFKIHINVILPSMPTNYLFKCDVIILVSAIP